MNVILSLIKDALMITLNTTNHCERQQTGQEPERGIAIQPNIAMCEGSLLLDKGIRAKARALSEHSHANVNDTERLVTMRNAEFLNVSNT